MNTVTIERTYDAPIMRVWEALTNKDQMKQWYFDVSDFKAEPGFKFQFTGGDEHVQYVHHCEVIEAEKPHILSYTWRYENIEGTSLVRIELFSEGENQTRVKLTHSGLDFKTDDKNFQPSSFNAGWNEILGTSLRNFVEKDTITKSILINASVENVWNTVINPNHDWAMAFGGGALAQTDWSEGSKIIWTDMDGNAAAKGIVEVSNGELLQLHYYDDFNPEIGELPGEYFEIFKLGNSAGGTLLEVTSGKLQKHYIKIHDDMWDDAIKRIKETAESKP